MAYNTTRQAPDYKGCQSLDAVIERLAVEQAALAQMRTLGVSFLGLQSDGSIKLATAAPNVAAKYGFVLDEPEPSIPTPPPSQGAWGKRPT